VNVLGKGQTYLKDVEQGDKVLVSDSSLDKYQEVYGFGHRDVYTVATFLQLTTSGNQENPLEITGEHLVMKQNLPTAGGIAVRADSIKVGDLLIDSQGVGDMVTKISTVSRPGLYSPLTKDGKILVNGVQVSSYTAVQDKHPENFVAGNLEVVSHHLLQHAAIAPYRVMCLVAGALTGVCEERNAEGQLLFVGEADAFIQNEGMFQTIVFSLSLPFVMCAYLTEQLFGVFAMVYLFPLVCLASGFLFVSSRSK